MSDPRTGTPAETNNEEASLQVHELKAQLQQRNDELAAAEAMRDEANSRLIETENRLAAERRMSEAGVVDMQAASVLLAERIDLAGEHEDEAISTAVDRLLLDKPFLRRPAGGLPPASASARTGETAAAGQLADAAERAAKSGDRKDVAEYLRLRRQVS